MADNVTGFKVDANISPFEESMRRMVEASRRAQSGVSSAFDGLTQSFAGLKGILLVIPALMTGGLVGGIIQSADALDELAEKTGISVQALAGLQYAAKMGGASSEGLTVGLRTLSKNISEVGQGNKELGSLFQQLGVQAVDASGNLRKADDVLMDLADLFPRLREADRIAVSMQLLGKAGMDMIPMLSGGKEGLQAMVEEGLKLNPVTEELTKNAGLFNDNIDKIGMTIRGGLLPAIEALLPALNNMASEMTVGTKVFGGFWAAMQGAGLTSPFRDTAEQVKFFNNEVTDLEASIKRYQSANSDTSGLQQALDMSRKRLQYFKELQGLENNRMADASASDPSNYSHEGHSKKTPAAVDYIKLKQPKEAAAKEQSQMPIFEAELSKKIALFEKAAQAEGTLRQYSKAEEAAYWQEVSTRAGVSAEDKSRAEKKWRDLERSLRSESFAVEIADIEQRKQAAQNNFAERILLAEQAHAKTVAMYGADTKEAAASMAKILEEKRKQMQQMQQLDDMAAQRRRDKALATIEFDRQDAEQQLAMGVITQEQLLVQEQQFEERMHAIKLHYLQQAQAAVDPQKDPVKKAEIDAQLEQLELQHQLRMGQIGNQVKATQGAPELNIFKGMETAFSEAASNMILQAQTLQQALSNVFKSVFTVFVQEMIVKPLAMSAARVIRESALYQALTGVAITSQAAASGAVVGMKAGETTAVVAGNAAQAATGAAASQASIPWVGPVLAMAAAAAMMSFVMGMGGKGGSSSTTTTRIPSASGGFDIPRGLNPMTQLHEQEMVLPAHIANPLRDSLAQGGAPGQGGDSAPVVISTTGGDFVHKRDLAKLLTQMKRNFQFS